MAVRASCVWRPTAPSRSPAKGGTLANEPGWTMDEMGLYSVVDVKYGQKIEVYIGVYLDK